MVKVDITFEKQCYMTFICLQDESFAAIEELYGINIQRDERSVRVMVSRKTGKPVVSSF